MPSERCVPCRTACENSVDARFHERRRKARTPLYGGSFAVLYSEGEEGDTEILAQILDISRLGISVRFFASASSVPLVSKIDITLPNQGFALQGLPVQVVNETADRTNGSQSNTNAKVRRLGLRFDEMPHPMAQALETLIERFACGRPD
ncbi:MAG: PilZ domain-containing protein [Desulfosarcinaceae bacterium]